MRGLARYSTQVKGFRHNKLKMVQHNTLIDAQGYNAKLLMNSAIFLAASGWAVTFVPLGSFLLLWILRIMRSPAGVLISFLVLEPCNALITVYSEGKKKFD